MSQHASSQIQNIAQIIERYLSTHPNAAETLEGVADHWLRAQRVEASVDQVQQALNRLINQGLIVQKRLPDGAVLYLHNN